MSKAGIGGALQRTDEAMVGGAPAEVLDAPGRLIVTPHPVLLDGQRSFTADPMPGESLAAFLARHVDGLETGDWSVTIGGFEVPRALWPRTYPRPGQLIAVRGSVHKSPLVLIGLGIAAFLFNLASPLVIGLVVGAGLIVKALKPKVPGTPSYGTAAQVYSLSGQRNQARQYAPIGTLLGEVRVTPDLAGNPYTYFESDDQYLSTILLGGINVHSYSDLSVGDTPLSSYNDVAVYTDGFSGMTSQAVPLFSNADSIAGGTLEDTAAWVTRTSSINAVMLQVDLEYQLFRQGDQGLENASLTVQAEYRLVGASSWTSFNSQTFVNKTMETRRVTWTRAVTGGQYEVRLRRTDGPNPDRVTRSVQWSTLRTVQPDSTDYSGWGRIGIRIKATGQLSGSLDTLRATFKPRPLPLWNGSAWVNATTRPGVSNPGAIVLQVLRGIYHDGVLQFGYGLADEQIDIEGLKAFMLHCTANGYTYDRWITETISLGSLLEEIALAGLGQFMWLDGSRPTVRWAADGQPLGGVVNMANMTRGSFSVNYQLTTAADGIEYQYVDRARNFEMVTLRVMAPGVTTMLNPARLTGQGVTTEAHAAVLARYHLAQSLYQYKEISFGADLERLDYQRMSMLSLSHDMTQWAYGGRLVAATTVSGNIVLTLDEPVPALPSRFVGLRVPGEREYRVFAVQAFSGTTDTITLTGSWPSGVAFPGDSSDNPAHDTLWCYDVKATPGYRVRVVAIEPDSDLKGATVRCVPESDEFWDYVQTGTYVPAPVGVVVPQLDAPAVSNIRVQAQTNAQGNTEWVQFNVVWDSTGDLDRCQVWAAIDGQPLRLVDGQAYGNRSSFRVDENGEWLIQVRPFDTRGRVGTSASVLYVTSVVNRPPANVDFFTVAEVDGGLRRYRFGYTGASPVAYAGVQIRYRAGSTAVVLADWDSLTPLGAATDVYTQATESTLPVAGTWTFACRSISTAGVLASSLRQVTITLDSAFADILTPELTPAPTPTGVAVTAGFAKLLITHDLPTYTQGHGHGKTRVYGVQYTGGAEPTISAATVLGEFTGVVGSIPSDLGVTWRIWVKWVTTDGVESTTAAGGSGANGIAATTGKVGSSDLGAAAVLSTALAPGAVTADKAALEIGGDNLVNNNSFEVDADGDGRADGWGEYNNSSSSEPAVLSRVAGRISGYAQRVAFASNSSTKGLLTSPVRGTGYRTFTSYVISWYAKASSAQSFGMQLAWNTAPFSAVPIKNPNLSTSWQRYAFRFVTGSPAETTLFVSILAGSNMSGWVDFDDFQVEEGDTLSGYQGKLAANTIVAGDGAIGNAAITNALIAAAAIDTAKIADAAIVTAKIADAQITGAKIQDATITTAKIGAAQITSALIADATITTAKIADGQITTAKIGDAQITTAKVGVLTANNLSVSAISGTVNGGASSTAGRIEITTNRIDVFDGSNQRRVRMGLL